MDIVLFYFHGRPAHSPLSLRADGGPPAISQYGVMQMQIVNGKEREVVEMLRGYGLNGYEAKASRGAMPDYKRLMAQGLSKKYQKQFFKDLGDAFELNQSYLSPIVYTVFESLGEDWHTVSIKEWIHRGADNFIGESINARAEQFRNSPVKPRFPSTEQTYDV